MWLLTCTDFILGCLLHRTNLERLIPVYSRYMTVCQKCIVRMYHDWTGKGKSLHGRLLWNQCSEPTQVPCRVLTQDTLQFLTPAGWNQTCHGTADNSVNRNQLMKSGKNCCIPRQTCLPWVIVDSLSHTQLFPHSRDLRDFARKIAVLT